MKLEIERDRLLKPLTQVAGVVERRQTLPILANILFRLDGDRLTLTGTDLEIEVTNIVEAVGGEEGACTVTARKALDICRALPEGAMVKFEADGDKAVIRSGRSRFTLQALPAAEFPSLETTQWEERFQLSQGAMRSLLESTAFSMAHQDVRYYLNGLLFDISGPLLTAVATDGHRLAKSQVSMSAPEADARQAIVPRKAVLELTRFLEDSETQLEVAFNANHIRVSVGGTVFTSKLIDGRFPDYAAVIAPKLNVSLLLDRVELHDTLMRAAILTNDKFRGVRVNIADGRLLVTAHNPEQEEATDEMPIDYEGTEIEIGFNVTYLMDAVKALHTENIEVRLQDANSGCTLNAPGDASTLYLVMPMRL